ncbi:MAG: tetratricopeptide repeat protein [Bacteroidales bacterium]
MVILFTLFISTIALAQRDLSEMADRDFEDQKYSVAIDLYKKAYSKTKDRDEKNRIRFQMAECYRLMNETNRAEVYYKSLVRTDYFKKEPIVLFYYAEMLKSNQNYDEAIPIYEQYIKLRPNDPRGPDGLKSCKLKKNGLKIPAATPLQISAI